MYLPAVITVYFVRGAIAHIYFINIRNQRLKGADINIPGEKAADLSGQGQLSVAESPGPSPTAQKGAFRARHTGDVLHLHRTFPVLKVLSFFNDENVRAAVLSEEFKCSEYAGRA